MAFYQFKREQIIPASLNDIWDFISKPENLKKITPPYMGFEITNQPANEQIYPGMIIAYKVKPLPAYKTTWVTEITAVEKERYFVDEQRIGPYAMWHHEHHLKHHEKGVLMTDIVTYSPPLGFIGALANRLFIKQQLNKIFNYRVKALEELFGTI
ncbi:MAG: hypothetical protein AB7S69_17690 [Salinivirgaceae bacterium]